MSWYPLSSWCGEVYDVEVLQSRNGCGGTVKMVRTHVETGAKDTVKFTPRKHESFLEMLERAEQMAEAYARIKFEGTLYDS